MKKKIVGIFVLMLLITTAVIPSLGSRNEIVQIEKTNKTYDDPLDGGWIEIKDNVKILHVNGSYYNMGYQQGFLLRDEINQNFRAYMDFLEIAGITMDDLIDLWNIMKDYIPEMYKEELQGLSDGSDLSFLEAAAVIMMEVINHDIAACFHATACDSATSNGNLYHIRSLDWPLIIVDPISGKYIQENQVIIIRKPSIGYSSVCPIMSGQITSHGGMNDQGICLSYTVSWCMNDISNHGIPTQLRERMVLDHASTFEEAIEIMDSNKTRGWTILISDKSSHKTNILELSGTHSYIGSWDDAVESTDPFWEIDHVLRRSNFFVEPSMASLQRNIYNPRGIIHWLIHGYVAKFFGMYDDYHYEYLPEVMHYLILSEMIEDQLGILDLEVLMNILRDHYSGKSDVVWGIYQDIFHWYRGVLHQWILCLDTGEIAISFADHDNGAYENPVHYFNLFELLEAEPP